MEYILEYGNWIVENNCETPFYILVIKKENKFTFTFKFTSLSMTLQLIVHFFYYSQQKHY